MVRTTLCLLLLLAAGLAGWGQEPAPPEPDDVVFVVRLHWPDHDLSRSQVRVFRDQARRDPVAAFPALDGTGRCLVALPAGQYYLVAVADTNGDQKVGSGDGLGFYGVVDPAASEPAPLTVDGQTLEVLITVSLTLGDDGKLRPTGVKEPTAMRWLRLEGRVSGLAPETGASVYFVPLGGGLCFACETGEGGAFSTLVMPARYYVFAVADADHSERVGPGDAVAVAGYDPAAGEAFPTVEIAADRPDLDLNMAWVIAPDGLLQSADGAGAGPRLDIETLPALVRGSVTGSGDPEAHGVARTFRSADARGEIARCRFTGPRFVLCLPAGVCFITVSSDLDGNGQAGSGDSIGFLGVSDLLQSHGPQPISLRAGDITTVEIALTGRLTADLRIEPIVTTPSE